MKQLSLLVGATIISAGAASAATTVFQVDMQQAGTAPADSQETQSGWTGWDVDKVTTNNSINTTIAGVGITVTANGSGYVTARGGGVGGGEWRGGEITGTSWNDVQEDIAVVRGGDGTATVDFTNLDSSKTYTLTLFNNESYHNTNIGPNTGFAGGTITPSMTIGTLVGAADNGLITYVIEGARTDGDFDHTVISFTPDGTNASILFTSSSNFVVFNGMQLEAVPEPSSAALLGLGGLALILRRRK